MGIKQNILGLVCIVLIASSLQAAEDNPVFRTLKYGFFGHHGWGGKAYALTKRPDLSVPQSMDEVADAFDVQKFTTDVASFKVEYIVFTAWHAEMNPIFPSKAMEKWRGPGHAAKRDVIGEVVKAFKAKGITLYLYIHTSDGHDMQPGDQERLGWNESTNIPPADAWAPGKYVRWNNFTGIPQKAEFSPDPSVFRGI